MASLYKTLKVYWKCVAKARFALQLELLRPLPLRWIVCWLAFRARIKHSRVASSIAGATAELKRRRAANALINKYLTVLLMPRSVAKVRAEVDFSVHGWRHIESALSQGRGAVLLTSHVGMPRLLRWYLQSLDYPICQVFAMDIPKVATKAEDHIKLWIRSRFQVQTEDLVGDEGFSIQYMKKAYDCLKQNGLVNIAGDGDISHRQVPVKILGRELRFPVGGLSLGLLGGAPVIPCFTAIEPGPALRIHIQDPLPVAEGRSRSEQLQELATAYAARVEEYIIGDSTNVHHSLYAPLLAD